MTCNIREHYFSYDFSKTGFISKDDVILVLSHVPVESNNGSRLGEIDQKMNEEKKLTKKTSSMIVNEEFLIRAESQKELNSLVETCFNRKITLSYTDFVYIIDYIDSGMFLCLLSLLRTHFPSLVEFQRYDLTHKKTELPPSKANKSRKLAVSKVLSKFAPVSGLTHSYSTEDLGPANKELNKELPKSKFSNATETKKPGTATGSRITNNKDNITPEETTSSDNGNENENEQMLFCQCGRQLVNFNSLQCDSCLKPDDDAKIEGFLYIEQKGGKYKKTWHVIENRMIYSYANKTDKTYSKMRSLVGSFINESTPIKIDVKTTGYPFILFFSNSIMTKFYLSSKEECKKWCDVIKKTIGYSDVNDYYTFKVLRILT